MGKYKHNFRYGVSDADEGPEYEVNTAFDKESLDWVAEDAAEHYISNHDGWESSWPLTFSIYETDSDELLGKFEVYCESVFSLRAVSK